MTLSFRHLVATLALAAVAVASWAEAPPMMNYTYTFEGSNEDRLIRNAQMRALRSTVGRFYFSDRLIIAQEILDRYLERNMSQFIAGVTVLDRQVDQGRYRLRMDVAVFARELEKTLEKFRFFVRPRATPLTFVFLSETVDAALPEVPVAKPLFAEALRDVGLEVSEIAIVSPSSRIDVAEGGTDPTLNPTLAEALTNGQRGGVDLIFTGQCTTTLTSNPDLYYDTYHFYDTSLLMRMLRVDTGELLDDVIVSDSASHPDDAVAREVAIRKCVGRAVGQLYETHRARWPYEVLNRTDYQLMITDVRPDELELLESKLEDLDEEAEVFRRSLFSDVACLNLNYSSEFATSPVEEREALVDFLVNLDVPQLRIELVDGRRIEAMVVR